MKKYLLFCLAAVMTVFAYGRKYQDAAAFMLKGDVRQVVTQSKSSCERLVFDEEGALTEWALNDVVAVLSDIQRDSNGRLLSLTSDFNGDCFTRTFAYNDKGQLTQREEYGCVTIFEYNDEGVVVSEDADGFGSSFADIETDGNGNWIKRTVYPDAMCDEGISESRVLTYNDGTQSGDTEGVCSLEDEAGSQSGRPTWEEIAIGVLLLIVLIAWIGHLIYTIFFVETKIDFLDIAQMTAQREAAGMAAEMTDDERNELYNIFHTIFTNDFTKNPHEPDQGLPTKHKQMISMRAHMAQAAAMLPNDVETVKQYNEYADLFNDCQERVFTGSKVFLWVGAIITGLLLFISGFQPGIILLGLPVVLYYFSSRKPSFMLYADQLKGKTQGVGFMNALLGGVFGAVATAKVVKTTYFDEHGNKLGSDTDHSETIVSLIFAVIVCLMVYMIMAAIALINYIRNYIIYW